MEFFPIYQKWYELVNSGVVKADQQIKFMNALLMIWNDNGRPEWVGIDDEHLSRVSKVPKSSLYKVKKALQKVGMISFRKSVTGVLVPSYSIKPFSDNYLKEVGGKSEGKSAIGRQKVGERSSIVPSLPEEEESKRREQQTEEAVDNRTFVRDAWEKNTGLPMSPKAMMDLAADVVNFADKSGDVLDAQSIVAFAIELGATDNKPVAYVSAMLRNWFNEGLYTLVAVKAGREKFRAKRIPPKTQPPQSNQTDDWSEERAVTQKLLEEMGL